MHAFNRQRITRWDLISWLSSPLAEWRGGAPTIMLAAVFVVFLSWTASPCVADSAYYACDMLQRLTRVKHPDGTTIDYAYDAIGNSLMKTTTLAGRPSNQPTEAVTNLSIANGVTNVPTIVTLSWSPAVDPNSGDTSFGRF